MTNKKSGNDFERVVCEILSRNGFWVLNIPQNQSGQPADIIAAKNFKPYLIDAKVCSGTKFDFSRIEENQMLSMRHWDECGNNTGWFAIKMAGEIYMLSYYTIARYLSLGKTFIELDDIIRRGAKIEEWAKEWVL